MEQDTGEAVTAPAHDPTARVYGTSGAAWYLGKAQITLRKWRVSGRGPAFRIINGRAFYTRTDLDDFVAAHRRFRSTSERTASMTAA